MKILQVKDLQDLLNNNDRMKVIKKLLSSNYDYILELSSWKLETIHYTIETILIEKGEN